MKNKHIQKLKEYLRTAVFVHVIFFLIFLVWSGRLLTAFILSTGLIYSIFGFGFYYQEIYLSKKGRQLLRSSNLKGLIEKGFRIDDEDGNINGIIDDYFVRAAWSTYYSKEACSFIIDIFFLEDIRLRRDLKSSPKIIWNLGFIRSILPATRKTVPKSNDILSEVKRMIDVLKQNNLSPVGYEHWKEIYKPKIEKFLEEKEKSRIKKQFKFLGLDIKLYKKAT